MSLDSLTAHGAVDTNPEAQLERVTAAWGRWGMAHGKTWAEMMTR